ncbi:MAG: Ig-like domain-containing protein [Ignavibacteriae bacterium]|nr:Ig-like domain-containing protein [Ignavibacteria bacterium]MBI3365156.1 Ig-like domain-containing protein [Ignavibacteriota bacterium]
MTIVMAYRYALIVLVCICCACRGPEGSMGPAGVGGEDYSALADSIIQPRVIFTDPTDQSIGPFDVYNRIQIRFNKIMDVNSLKRAISFSADGESVFLDTTSIATEEGDIVTISARDSVRIASFRWKIGTSYTLTIAGSASDVNGNHLHETFLMTFMPEPVFRILSVTPKNGTTNAKLNTVVRITFNSPVSDTILSFVTITPAISGNWSLSSNALMLSFKPLGITRRGFDIGTTYVVALPSSAHDQYGNVLVSDFSSRFTTIPFRVSSSSPWDGATAVSRTSMLRLNFTAAVDIQTLHQAITVIPSTDIIIGYSSARSVVYVSPASSWLPFSLYTVTVDSSLRSATGKNMAVPFVLHFTTAE